MPCARICLRLVRIDAALEVDEFLVRALATACCVSVVRAARRAPWPVPAGASGVFSSSCGLAQIDSTGVDTASGSPLRSVIMPREVGIGDLAQEALVALLLVEIVVDQLQVDRAADQRDRAQAQRADDQQQATAQVEQRAARGLPAPTSRCDSRCSRPLCARRSCGVHGRTTTIRRLPGTSCPGGCARPGRCGCFRPRSPVPAAGGRIRC